jgi:hypothetical protein
MAVAFVTMGVGVNARTAFSLLFRSKQLGALPGPGDQGG